ncbi:ectoine hydroxylase-related dioxygenase (phytanoyl-CoA dioxygenase family) [Sphingomonas sp. UYAg733]
MTSSSNTLIDAWADRLQRDGYCIIPNVLPKADITALDDELAPTFARTPYCQGGFYGAKTKRFGRLLARSDRMPMLVQHPLITGIVERLLSPWCDTLQLNVTQAIAVHPGALAQLPHRDQDMWAASKGEVEYLVNVIWPLTQFRAENGATMVWPHSHGVKALEIAPDTDPVPAEMAPGSALLFLGSTLHGAGGNVTREIRRGLVVGYALGWLKPYENQWLAYPPPVARSFSPELAALVGYRQHRPNLGNYEGQCPSVLLGEDVPDAIGAIDALRPHQEAMIAAFVDDQRRAS